MDNKIIPKVLIFDLDDTLYQRYGVVGDDYSGLENIRLYPGVRELLERKEVKKVLVSKGEPLIQYKKLELLGIKNSFDLILICSTDEEKRDCFIQVKEKFPGHEFLVIGDRLDSEIRQGKALEMKTILIRQGKYASLMPKDGEEVPDLELKGFPELFEVLNLNSERENILSMDAPKVEFPFDKKRFFEQCVKNKNFPRNDFEKQAVLLVLLEDFEEGIRYKEEEVNNKIRKHFEDVSLLRRELINYGYMQRDAYTGEYWVVKRTITWEEVKKNTLLWRHAQAYLSPKEKGFTEEEEREK